MTKVARLGYLDGWRGLAIISVLAGHFIRGAEAFGALGVELFFVLSGRLMAEILFDQKMPLGPFFKRRISRIVPALIGFVVLMFGISEFARYRHIESKFLVDPVDALASLSFTMNYAVALFHRNSILVHLWSVSLEEHSYILLAIMALLCARREKPAAVICLLISALAMVNGYRLWSQGVGGIHEIYWRTDVRIGSSFLSVAAWVASRQFRSYPPLLGVIFLLSGIAVMVCDTPIPLRYIVGPPLIAIAVNLIDGSPAILLKLLAWPGLTLIGAWSYSLYLWQQPFYIGLSKMPAPVACLGLVICALASHYVIERPARRWINEHW